MPKPLITVLIDTYNHGRFIEEAIDSVLAQDFPPDQLEILVVDDGSTDDTSVRVKKYGAPVQYLYKTNGGQGSAFNYGFERAKGEIIALLDGDDTWLPGKLKRITEEFAKNPEVGMVYHPYLEVDMKTGQTRVSDFYPVSGNFFDDENAFRTYRAPGTCASFRRESLGRVMPVPDGLITQADGYIESLLPLLAPVLAIQECLATYRFHDGNLYHSSERPPLEFAKKRAAMTEVMVRSVHRWLRTHGYSMHVRYRSFVAALTMWQERITFEIEPPGRARFFWFVIRENYFLSYHDPTQNPRVTAFNYLSSPLALLFGYKNEEAMQRCRGNALDALHDLISRFVKSPNENLNQRAGNGTGIGNRL